MLATSPLTPLRGPRRLAVPSTRCADHRRHGGTVLFRVVVARSCVTEGSISDRFESSFHQTFSLCINTCMDLQWVNSQINFSRIAIMVQPLKDEIAALQLESDKATQQKRTLEAQIDELERSIARLVPRVLFG